MNQAPVLFDAIGGTKMCRELSQAFYARVERDPLLKPFFPGKSMRCAIEAFAAFLVQFLGGPSDDSQSRWFVSLHESHQRFQIEKKHRDAWMRCMDEALGDVGIEEPARGALHNFFDLASLHLIGGKPGARRMNRELARRWAAQRSADDAVAAIRAGDADRAIRLAGECDRAVQPGLLAMMMHSRNQEMVQYVHERLTGDHSLIHERYWGRTMLHNASAAGSLRTVELLLRMGADPNVLDGGSHTPLYSVGNECAGAESAEVVHALVRKGAQVDAHDGVTGATPLHMAARRGNAVVAKALLECGADPKARDRRGDTPVQRAINCKKPHVAELLRSYKR